MKTPPSAISSTAHRDRLGLTNMQIRSFTILTMGPLCIFVFTWSKSSATFLVLVCLFIGGIEWSGLKRHLKVALLAPRELQGGGGKEGVPALCGLRKVAPPLLDDPLLVPNEYPVPVSPLSVYGVFKYLGWSLLALAASYSEVVYITVLAFYMLIFVCVTLMAQSRLEDRMEWAVERLASQFYSGAIELGDRDPNSSKEKASKGTQQRYFLALELRVIAEKQPAEQFLDICLDLFGVMWLSGLVYFLFLYDVPGLGLPWSASVLLSNFFNDITALVVGKGLRKLRVKYSHFYNCALDSDSSECRVHKQVSTVHKPNLHPRDNSEKKLRSASSFCVRYILSSPHSLCPTISPNKSVEGAVSGVIMNAISFTAILSFCYRFIIDYPDSSIISPKFQSTLLWFSLGICVGVAGVLGDLLQSLLKRVARVKDTGFIIPGHGGILDRVDGMLLAFPFMYCAVSVLRALS